MYKVHEVVKLSGVSARTLRHYEEIGLLHPRKDPNNGYRYYNDADLDLLQTILLYRSMELSLKEILEIVNEDSFTIVSALEEHLTNLYHKELQLQSLIESVKQSIKHQKGEITMKTEEKFRAFKEDMLNKNEEQYGDEIRERYGEEQVKKSNKKFMNMSKEEYDKQEQLAKDIILSLKQAFETKDPLSKEARHVCSLHQEWIKKWWPTYSVEAHINLCEMYTVDDRFRTYYDEPCGTGAADFLFEAMKVNLM